MAQSFGSKQKKVFHQFISEASGTKTKTEPSLSILSTMEEDGAKLPNN